MKNTTLCYIEHDGCYLLLHRIKKKDDENQGKWIGIGGKLEENESPEECALREVREETGLTLTQYRYCGLITFVSDRWEGEYMHLFHATSFTGQLTGCEEGILQWVPIAQFNELPHWEGDTIFLRLMQQNGPFFSLKLCYQGDHLAGAALNGVTIC